VGLRGAAHLTVALVAIAVGAPSSASAEIVRPVVDARLANGMRVVACPDPASPDVAVEVRYDVGSRDDPGGLEGLAHLAEHAMFGASKHLARGLLWRILESAGATDVNGNTSFDATVYHETVPPEALERALWVESERMGYLLESVDDASVARHRATVMSEYRERISLTRLSAVTAAVFEELFPAWHPYHHLPLGWLGSLERIEARDVRAFLGTWCGPANATLIVAGKTEPAAVLGLAAKYFGTLPPRAPPARPRLPPLPPLGARLVHVEADVKREVLRVAWTTPAFGTSGDRELDVAATLLRRELDQRMVRHAPIATWVGCGQQSLGLASIFSVEAEAAPGHHASELLAVVDEAIARLGREVAVDHFGAALLFLQHGDLFRLESNRVWASRVGLRLPLGAFPSVFDGGAASWAGVSAESMRETTRRYLSRANRVVVVVDPTGWRPASGVVARRGDREL
jgi:predicted Zn-dependent peptidase